MIKTDKFAFQYGGHVPIASVGLGEPFEIYTEDAFCGQITSKDDKPRELAPFPKINPLTGPIAIDGVRTGDVIAVHIIAMDSMCDWGVATISPNFGLLSSSPLSPNLQPDQDEHVWIWEFSTDRQSLVTKSSNGVLLRVPYQPFHGTIGVAPAHGEIRLGLVAGEFGGNLDITDIGPGSTIYLRSNVDGGHLYVGDGHYAQGDGEITGTAIEGSFNSTLVVDQFSSQDEILWPRFENNTHIGVIGCARPLDDAVRIAATELVYWVASIATLELPDAHQLVSQTCKIRIGGMVGTTFNVLCIIPKNVLSSEVCIFDNVHGTLASKSL